MKALIRRILPLLCCLQFCCALYLLQLRRGRVCWYDARSGVWHETNICADALSRSDRALLSNGLSFDSRAELTRALEDFCS